MVLRPVKGNASDVTKKRRVKEIYCTVRNDVTDGVYVNTKRLSVNADDTLNHVESQQLRRDLIDGQNCYYQDVSRNSAYVSEYTQVYNPDPCDPQVVDLSNIAGFDNAYPPYRDCHRGGFYCCYAIFDFCPFARKPHPKGHGGHGCKAVELHKNKP